MAEKETIRLELLEIEQGEAVDGVQRVTLKTNNGDITGSYHAGAGGEAAVLWVEGTDGGPGEGMYERVASQLSEENIASLRLDYRFPGQLIDSVLDVLLGIGFLRTKGRRRVALVGHGFGGPVAINAALANPAAIAVAALSPQMTGADDIGELSPRPVLLMHGTADEVFSDIGSRELFRLAGEPKELLLYEGCGHGLEACREQVEADLMAWVRRVSNRPTP